MITEIPTNAPIRNRQGQLAEFHRLCRGDAEAVHFCVLHDRYAHMLDDLIDMDKPADPGVFALLCMEIYSSPFFQRNSIALRTVMRLSHSNWLDANEWEKSPVAWQRTEADTIRHSGADVIRVVADLCGGWEAMRSISPVLRILGYEDHHDADGKPT